MNAQPPTLLPAQRLRGVDRPKANQAAIDRANEASRAAEAELRGSAEPAQATEETAPAAKPTAPDKSAKARPVRTIAHISPNNSHLAASKRNEFFMVAPHDSVPADFNGNPEPFTLIAAAMARYSKVTIVHPAGLWYAEGVVVDHLAPSYAVVTITHAMNLAPRKSAMADLVPKGHRIRQGGADEEPWVVERVGDDGTVTNMSRGNFPKTFDEARALLLAHATLRGESQPMYY